MTDNFPVDPNARVLATLKGGIGDVLMIAAACSPLVKEFVFCVEDHQIPILEHIPGCTPKSFDYFREQRFQRNYDACVNFMFFLSSGTALKSGDYYSLIGKKIGRRDQTLEIQPLDFNRGEKGGIYVHMSASNPNRDWLRDRWERVIPRLAEIDTVHLLGRSCEFKVEGANINVLSDQSDDLVWQAEELSTAKHFLGVDSGFAHIAGLMRRGLPGHVLFFNTLPDDVIGRYPTLKGLENFGGCCPSRSCKVPCEVSDAYKQALTEDEVVSAVQEAYNKR